MNDTNKEAWTSGKNISPAAMKKRKSINKKILKFGCLPIVILFFLAFVASLFTSSDGTKKSSMDPSNYNDPLQIGMDSVKALEGKQIPYEKWAVWGDPKTLDGTSNQYWVVYLDKANISFVADKNTNNIIFASFEEQTAKSYIASLLKERKEKIEKSFSGWDGSHIELTKLIKKSMNDPDSYEHVETRYFDMGDHLVVTTTFRGKNGFGGVVKNWVKAKTDVTTGQVIEIIEQGP